LLSFAIGVLVGILLFIAVAMPIINRSQDNV
jgi:hypothetical protein